MWVWLGGVALWEGRGFVKGAWLGEGAWSMDGEGRGRGLGR